MKTVIELAGSDNRLIENDKVRLGRKQLICIIEHNNKIAYMNIDHQASSSALVLCFSTWTTVVVVA